MNTFLKILLIGFIATVCRIICQLFIPPGTQNVLAPSIFIENGTMPIAFSIYGLVAYSIISSMFLLIRNNMSGKKVIQGLKYGIACCFVWVIYLLEPLPHVAFCDKFTYPLADSTALLVMGILTGLFLGKTTPSIKKDIRIIKKVQSIVVISLFFVVGRLAQYFIFDIYSSFHDKTIETIIWCIITGTIISCVIVWLDLYINKVNMFRSAILLGVLLYGADLFLFNFSVLLSFASDIPDLIIRTLIDVISVTVGCFFIKGGKKSIEKI